MDKNSGVDLDKESVNIFDLIKWLSEYEENEGKKIQMVIRMKDGSGIAFYLPDKEVLDKMEKEE